MSQQLFVDFAASADYLGTGAIEVNQYEDVILDIVRRTSVALQRFRDVPATGQPHRYFEQTAIGTAAFGSTGGGNPNTGSTSPISPTATGPTRVERPAFIKAITNQTNITLFDKMVTQQQKQFAQVVAQDVEDTLSAIQVTRAQALWNGNDTSLSAPTTLQYVGLLTQITQQATCAPGVSIIDVLKAQVAAMVANPSFNVRPTAIYLNPVLNDYVDREAKAGNIILDQVEVAAGVTVSAINTQAGKLPLIGEAFLPSATAAAYGFSAPPAGFKNYFAVIVTERLIELPYVSGESQNPNPMLFQLGLTGNLSGQYVGVKFDAVVAKGATYAHTVVCVQRP